ncbi:hypothetical protein NEPAR05_2447, partial [Nematocida parisii]
LSASASACLSALLSPQASLPSPRCARAKAHTHSSPHAPFAEPPCACARERRLSTPPRPRTAMGDRVAPEITHPPRDGLRPPESSTDRCACTHARMDGCMHPASGVIPARRWRALFCLPSANPRSVCLADVTWRDVTPPFALCQGTYLSTAARALPVCTSENTPRPCPTERPLCLPQMNEYERMNERKKKKSAQKRMHALFCEAEKKDPLPTPTLRLPPPGLCVRPAQREITPAFKGVRLRLTGRTPAHTPPTPCAPLLTPLPPPFEFSPRKGEDTDRQREGNPPLYQASLQ